MDWKSVLIRCGTAEDAKARVVEKLEAGVDIHAVLVHGKNLIHVAAKLDNIAVAELGIRQGVSVHDQAYVSSWKRRSRPDKRTLGWTPLHYVARSGSPEMVRLLLDSVAGGPEKVSFSHLETPADVAYKDRLWETHLVFVEYGLANLEMFAPWASDFIALSHTPNTLLAHLERTLFNATFNEQADYDLSHLPNDHCDTCQTRLNNESPVIRDIWERRQRRMTLRMPDGANFSYGLIKRCTLCRKPVVPVPIPVLAENLVPESGIREAYGVLSPAPKEGNLCSIDIWL